MGFYISVVHERGTGTETDIEPLIGRHDVG